ncbi:MAG: polyprenyl synthetase family protein [Chloroflexi bacterium]|nr:polyprenyl synthetase family protein [Chloroflexota bacterium]
MELAQIVDLYAPIIENELHSAFERLEEQGSVSELGPLHDMLRYHLGWVEEGGKPAISRGGKRIRPTLCLLACEAAGGDSRLALPVATAIELIHNFTLVHDDIQDRSEERRHRPTVWKVWGDAQAINAGDALYAAAFLELFRLTHRGVSADSVLEAATIVNTALIRICEGQFLDISFETTMNVTTELYLAMIARKTAALIACSTQIGALLGSGNAELAERYRLFGHSLGMAFQIQDDILGIWGEFSDTGKPTCDDILKRKKTLPVIFALAGADPAQRRLLEETFMGESVDLERAEGVQVILTALGARQYAEEAAQQWHDEAMRQLDAARPVADAGNKMGTLASALLGRKR